jgi:hypothetical protein
MPDSVREWRRGDIPAWHDVHDFIYGTCPKCQSDYTERMWQLLGSHGSTKVRIEYAESFKWRVLNGRLATGPDDTSRRDFEAWLFFARSALDCGAMFINELCGLALNEWKTNIFTVTDVIVNADKWPELEAALCTHVGHPTRTPWLAHMNDLRRLSSHRQVVSTSKFLYIGSQGPELPDELFVSPTPSVRGGHIHAREWGIGEYVTDKQAKVVAAIEGMERVFLFYLQTGKVCV